MRVKFLTMACGPACSYLPGQIADVNETWGRQLVDGGFATSILPSESSAPKATPVDSAPATLVSQDTEPAEDLAENQKAKRKRGES